MLKLHIFKIRGSHNTNKGHLKDTWYNIIQWVEAIRTYDVTKQAILNIKKCLNSIQ